MINMDNRDVGTLKHLEAEKSTFGLLKDRKTFAVALEIAAILIFCRLSVKDEVQVKLARIRTKITCVVLL